MATAPLSDMLCEISSNSTALPMFFTPLLHTLLYDMMSSCNVLLFLRYSLMAIAPSSGILLCEISIIL